MKKIRLVIDIDYEDYEAIKNMSVVGDMTIPYVFNAIRNGTPLPKGHGDLKDHNDIIKSLFDFTSGNKTLGQCIDDAPTIIEAEEG